MKKKLEIKKMNKKNKNNDLFYLQSELKKTELLLEITKRIAGLKDLSQILWTIIDFVTLNVDGDRGSLFLNDEETNELYSRIAQGDLTREIRILNTVGIAGAIFTARKGEIIHNVYEDSRFNKEVDQETGYRTKNMICSPVKTVDGKIIGVIQVLNKKKGRFTKENLNFVNAIATQAAVSIQNAQNSEFFEKKEHKKWNLLVLCLMLQQK